VDLAELDAELERMERVRRLASECGFQRLVARIERDVEECILPRLMLLLMAADGETRAALAQRFRRLKSIGELTSHSRARYRPLRKRK
jgi:hypothetical protein